MENLKNGKEIKYDLEIPVLP
jgi:hypothetical protein